MKSTTRLALMLIPCLAYPAVAEVSPVCSYAQPTADGQYLFVMVLPAERVHGDPNDDPIRAKYGRSGLYPAVGGPAIWTTEAVIERATAYPISDGIHLVSPHCEEMNCYRVGWGPQLKAGGSICDVAANTLAIQLYRKGAVFKSYTAGELFNCSRFSDENLWWGQADAPDEARGTVRLNAETGEWVVISYRTGEIVDRGGRGELPPMLCGNNGPKSSRWVPFLAVGTSVVVAGTAAFLVVVWLMLRNAKRVSS